MFVKNLVLEFKKLKTNQNTGFFKLEYLTNKLRYEVEFFGSNYRSMKATNINWLPQHA